MTPLRPGQGKRRVNRDPLRRVLRSELWWQGNPHQCGNLYGNRTFRRERLECGHIGEFGTDERKRRRCDECALEERRRRREERKR